MPKTTVEDCMPLTVTSFRQKGLLDGKSYTGSTRWGGEKTLLEAYWTITPDEIRLSYVGPDRRYYEVSTDIVYSYLYHGAPRAWWLCPECGRRCGMLYLPLGSTVFACRTCHDLVYRCQQEWWRRGVASRVNQWPLIRQMKAEQKARRERALQIREEYERKKEQKRQERAMRVKTGALAVG